MSKPSRWIAMLPAALLVIASSAAFAHEGHDHGADDAATVTTTHAAAPRLSLSSSTVELVAVREPEALVIYVDDYATNAPLDGLTVQVQLGSQVIAAAPAGAGTYTVADAVLDEATEGGAQAPSVKFLLHGTALDAQLEGALPLPQSIAQDSKPAAPTTRMNTWAAIAIGLAALALILDLSLFRRRRRIAA